MRQSSNHLSGRTGPELVQKLATRIPVLVPGVPKRRVPPLVAHQHQPPIERDQSVHELKVGRHGPERVVQRRPAHVVAPANGHSSLRDQDIDHVQESSPASHVHETLAELIAARQILALAQEPPELGDVCGAHGVDGGHGVVLEGLRSDRLPESGAGQRRRRDCVQAAGVQD